MYGAYQTQYKWRSNKWGVTQIGISCGNKCYTIQIGIDYEK